MKKATIIKIMLLLSILTLCEYTQPMNQNSGNKRNNNKQQKKKSKKKHKNKNKKNKQQQSGQKKKPQILLDPNKDFTNEFLGNYNRLTSLKARLAKIRGKKTTIKIDNNILKKDNIRPYKVKILLGAKHDNLLSFITAQNRKAIDKFRFINTMLKNLFIENGTKNQELLTFTEEEKKSFLNAKNESTEETALMIALKGIFQTNEKEEYANITKLLILSGADVTIPNTRGETTLSLIMDIENKDTRQDLFNLLLQALKSNFDSNEITIENYEITPIVQNNYRQKDIKSFLAIEEKINKDNYRKTALGRSIMNHQNDIVEPIIDMIHDHFNAKIDIVWYNIAISASNTPIIEKLGKNNILKKQGISKGQKGRSLVPIIIRHCEGSVIHTPGAKRNSIKTSTQLLKKALQNYNGSLLSQNIYNMTPLHIMILKGNLPLLHIAIKYSKITDLISALAKKCQHKHNVNNHGCEKRICECCKYVKGKTPLQMLIEENNTNRFRDRGRVRGRGRGRNRGRAGFRNINTRNTNWTSSININREMLPIIAAPDKKITNKLANTYPDILRKITITTEEEEEEETPEEVTTREIHTIIAPLVINRMRKIILKTQNIDTQETLTQLFLRPTGKYKKREKSELQNDLEKIRKLYKNTK